MVQMGAFRLSLQLTNSSRMPNHSEAISSHVQLLWFGHAVPDWFLFLCSIISSYFASIERSSEACLILGRSHNPCWQCGFTYRTYLQVGVCSVAVPFLFNNFLCRLIILYGRCIIFQTIPSGLQLSGLCEMLGLRVNACCSSWEDISGNLEVKQPLQNCLFVKMQLLCLFSALNGKK